MQVSGGRYDMFYHIYTFATEAEKFQVVTAGSKFKMQILTTTNDETMGDVTQRWRRALRGHKVGRSGEEDTMATARCS
jgi:hypothetical protein